MKVKICGVCRPQDAAAAARAGADYVGVILAPHGRRTQDARNAAAIYERATPLLRAGVFCDQPFAEVERLARALRLDVLQLHGNENADLISALAEATGAAIWKTVWLNAPADLESAIDAYAGCAHGLLLDAAHGAGRGGTGMRFDWGLAADARRMIPARVGLIVAGGLSPDNVATAVEMLRPDVVDVASGVEATICEKSQSAIHAFVRNAKQ